MITIKLNKDDKPKLLEHAKQFKDSIEALCDSVMGHGYKMSMSYVDSRSSYVVTVTGTDDTKHNARTSMSSWSDDLIEAILMTSYKVNVVTRGGSWKEFAVESPEWG